ncbi:MAG TPA: metal-dependent hydrolase [Chondromyces sp.]|nr:metal-dependent hydrolase [Chondromyces sp.]
MKGSTHLAIGGATGLGVAMYLQTGPLTTIALVGVGAVSGLAPDLDINGKLSNRITVSKKWLHSFFAVMGVLLFGYSLFNLAGFEKWAGFIIGVALTVLPRIFIKQRTMLFITGACIGWSGYEFELLWVMLLSGFIMIASFLPHRSLTHSLIGAACFGVIAYQFEQSVQIEGSYAAGLLAYLSHLIADMKALPSNRRGVKWFQPFFNKEF